MAGYTRWLLSNMLAKRRRKKYALQLIRFGHRGDWRLARNSGGRAPATTAQELRRSVLILLIGTTSGNGL